MAEQFDFLKTIQDETNLINLDKEQEPIHIINENYIEKYTIENIDKLDIHSIAGDELFSNIFNNAAKTLSTMEEYIDNDSLSKNQLKIRSKNLFSIVDQYNMLTCYMSVDEGSQIRSFDDDFSRMSPSEAKSGRYNTNSLSFKLRDELSGARYVDGSQGGYLTLLRDAYLVNDTESNAVSLVDVSDSERFHELNSDSLSNEFCNLTTYELAFQRVHCPSGGDYGGEGCSSRTRNVEMHLLNLIHEYGSNENDFKLDESSLFDSAYSTINESSISIKEPVSAKHYEDINFDSYELDDNDEDDSDDIVDDFESEDDKLLNNTELCNRARNVIGDFDYLTRERKLEILNIFKYNDDLNSENEE